MPLRIKFAILSQEADNRQGQRRLDNTCFSFSHFWWLWKCYDNISFDPGASNPFSTLQPGWCFKTDAIMSIPSLFMDSPLSSGQSLNSLSLLKSILPFGIGLYHWSHWFHSSQKEQLWILKPSQVGFLPKLFMPMLPTIPCPLSQINTVYLPQPNFSWLPKSEFGVSSLCSSNILYLPLWEHGSHCM